MSDQPEIKIYRQNRRSMMMRPAPGLLEVFIPHQLSEDDSIVKDFIKKGLKQLGDQVPDIPEEKTTRAQIDAMVADYAQRIGVQPTRVQFRDMRRKWGSCSSRGTITLNARLMWLEYHLAEYVVCHELVHLIHLDHSQKFWNALGDYMPDYQARLDELRVVEKALW